MDTSVRAGSSARTCDRKTSLVRASAAKHDLSDAVVRQIFVTSRDGTRVPNDLDPRPGIALDGNNRTLLYGYGGFGVSLWPGYSEKVAAWVRLGGVYAIAAIRGGGEFGQPWHDGGRSPESRTCSTTSSPRPNG